MNMGGFKPFQKGEGGRPAGIPNKATREIRAMARSLVEDPEYVENLRIRLRSGKCAPAVECMLFHYAYGEPPKTLIVAGDAESPWAKAFAAMPQPQIVDITAKYLGAAPENGNGNGNGNH